MLSFRYIGHACIQITYQSQSVLIDPWFGYAFHGGNMIAYPPISPPPPAVLNSVSLVHISHIHQDHFCRKSLNHIPKATPIVIGQYQNQRFQQTISQCGFTRLIQCPAEGISFGPFRLDVFPLVPFDGSFDSLVVISAGGRTILVNNDCVLSESRYREIRTALGPIDFGFLGYCSVSPYPACYQVQGQDSESLLVESQQQSWDHVTLMDSIFNFKRIIPYANGIRLVERSTRHFNRAFNRIDQASKFLPKSVVAKIFLAEPGAEWDEDFTPAALKFNYESDLISDYFDANGIDHLYSFPTESPIEAEEYRRFFESYFGRIQKKLGESLDVACRILDSDGNPIRAFRFASNLIQLADAELLRQAPIVIDYPVRWINEVVRGRMSIASIYYAFQFRATFKRPIRIETERINHWF